MRFPEWVVPMAATLTDKRFTGPEWIFERKYDGIRLLAFRNGHAVQLFSRNQLLQHHPAIAEAIGSLDLDNVILDGEVDWGGPTVEYHVFDILWLNGRNLMPLPLTERRAMLHQLRLTHPVHAVAEVTGGQPWEQACREGWEGVIAKRRDSPYEHRRSPHWLKMKCEAVAGTGRGRIYRSSGNASGAREHCCSATSKVTTSCSPEKSARDLT